jgi:hypothetical protein
MRTLLVIKLGSTLPEIRKAAGTDVEVVHVNELDAALERLESSTVDLVLLSEVTFRGPVGGFLALLQERAPGKNVAVMVIDLMNPEKEIAVHEGGALAGAVVRSVPMRELRQELLRLCDAGASSPPLAPGGVNPPASQREAPSADQRARAAELRRIGFNDCVARGSRAVHIQTEVLGGEPLRVRSTVMEGGGILDATTRSVNIGELPLAEVQALVRSQHDSVVAEVRGGRYG